MDISFLLRGFLIGLSIAATVGPMSVLCMQRTLQKGFLYGLVLGLGIATADGIYGAIAGFGLSIVTTFLVHQQVWIRSIGGLFLIYLGIRTVLTHPAARAAVAAQATNFVCAYVSTLLLTLTNPLTILSFIAIFAGLGVGMGNGNHSLLASLFVVSGVFLGSALWWVVLSRGISLLRVKVTQSWLLWINRISGCVIVSFGVLALVTICCW